MSQPGGESRITNGGSRDVVSIREVAHLAGVSIATVSRCINSPEKVTERTRLKVQQAIDDTGYLPNALARNFRRGRTNIVLVAVPSIGEPFFASIMRGVNDCAAASGYSVIIEEVHMQPADSEKDGVAFVARQADGVVLLCNIPSQELGILRSANQKRLPIIVGFEATSPTLADCSSVHVDNANAAKAATEHLIELGHRRIAMISGTEQLGLTIDRESGYREAMSAADLPVADGWVVDGCLSIGGAQGATQRLLSHPHPPTAIFAASDEMAFGCLHEIKAAGMRVPDDMSVVGFDDIRYAAVADPPLTTIRQPTEQIGARAMQLLFAEIDGKSDAGAVSEVLPFELIVRSSTAPPRD